MSYGAEGMRGVEFGVSSESKVRPALPIELGYFQKQESPSGNSNEYLQRGDFGAENNYNNNKVDNRFIIIPAQCCQKRRSGFRRQNIAGKPPSASHICDFGTTSASAARAWIFGPVWPVARVLGLVPAGDADLWTIGKPPMPTARSTPSWAERLIHGALPTAVVLPLLARVIYFASSVRNIGSVEWCYTVLLMFVSIHSLVSVITLLFSFKRKDFFQITILDYLQIGIASAKNGEENGNSNHCARRRRVFFALLAMALVMFFSTLWFSFENSIHRREIFANTRNDTKNSTELPYFRRSLYGDAIAFTMLDVVIMLWGTAVSAIALALVFLTNFAFYNRYRDFHEQVKSMQTKNRPNLQYDEAFVDVALNRAANARRKQFHESVESNPTIIVDKALEFFGSPDSQRSITPPASQGRPPRTPMLKQTSVGSGGKDDAGMTAIPEQSEPSGAHRMENPAEGPLPDEILDGELGNLPTLARIDARLIDFLRAFCHVNQRTEPIMTVTFLNVILMYVISTYALRRQSAELDGLDRTTFVTWLVVGLMYAIVTFFPCTNIHSAIHAVAVNIARRIEMVGYESKLFSVFRVTNSFFNLVILIVPFFVDYVIAPPKS